MIYDNLVQLVQEEKITLDEFVFYQDELKEDYLLFLSKNNIERSNQGASQFLDYYENNIVMNELNF